MLSRNVERFRGVLVFEAHRLLYHSTLGFRVIKEKKKVLTGGSLVELSFAWDIPRWVRDLMRAKTPYLPSEEGTPWYVCGLLAD